MRRIDAWRGADLRRDMCVSGSSLVTREFDKPGSVWPPRPRARYRQPVRMRPLTRMFVDLVQEQQELGAQALIIAHAELADLSGYRNRVDGAGHIFASRPVQYAVAEALRLGLVEQVPFFEEQDESKRPRRMVRSTKPKHSLREGKPAYRLGPLARIELQRAFERATRPTGWAERQISAETRKLAARNRRFSSYSFERSDPDPALPEEAPEDPRTGVAVSADDGCAVESVSPAATAEFSPRHASGPTVDAPPLELRNSWTREAAAPPPRRAGAADSPAPGARNSRSNGPRSLCGERSPAADGTDVPLAELLAKLRQQYGERE